MLYLSQFTFPDEEQEFDFRLTVKRTCYNTMYPFGVLSACGLTVLDFEPLTLLCGGNGSGKTTALNVIGEKLGLPRQSPCNSSSFFGDYAALCRYTLNRPVPHGSRVITSDDVFDFMLDLRALNAGIDRQREDLLAEYADNRHSEFRLKSLADYEQLRRVVDARRMTQSRYTRERMKENVREHSNGESAFSFFTGTIGDDRLFLLDEGNKLVYVISIYLGCRNFRIRVAFQFGSQVITFGFCTAGKTQFRKYITHLTAFLNRYGGNAATTNDKNFTHSSLLSV